MFSIVFISKSFLWFHKGSFMMQLHEVCLTVMAGQPGGSVGKAVGHLHWPCSGVTWTPRWPFWIQGRILHRLILARFAISASPSKRVEAFAIPAAVLAPRCGLPLRRAKFTGISTEFGGRWELCVLRKNKSPLRKKLSKGLCIFCQAALGFILNCLLSWLFENCTD